MKIKGRGQIIWKLRKWNLCEDVGDGTTHDVLQLFFYRNCGMVRSFIETVSPGVEEGGDHLKKES